SMPRSPHGKEDPESAPFSRERQSAPSGEAVVEVPDRLYFRIGEVSAITGIPPYVLRYWESEFPSLQPKKSGGGQRLYRKRDVIVVLEIKKLLYQERYTVAGARKRLTEREERSRRIEARATLARLRAGLEAILQRLS
ncbi:MAG: MerR family transcriptional regulator, partial [Candidatus Methylomirabilota bacterium]